MQEKIKVWRLSPDSNAYVRLEDNAVVIGNGPKNFIAIDDNGLTLRGNMSFGCMGEGQRTGGFFINTNEFIRMIPTTIITPIPPLIPIPPFGFAKTIIKAVQAVVALTMIA